MTEPLLSELSRPGRVGQRFASPEQCRGAVDDLPPELLRGELPLPELGELDVVRHFTHLSTMNHSIDAGFYPLGSCTMKYNPKVDEDVARLPGFAQLHPYQPEESVQGALEVMLELQRLLAEITGFAAVTLQPAAGAQAELCGMLLIRAYHRERGDLKRSKVLIPDSAHGTNPATAAMCGYSTISIPTDSHGNVDLGRLKEIADQETVGLMLTNPNTLGLFEQEILEVTETVHRAGGLVYGDGANLNAILGAVKPADLGFDVLHINTHKTFSTPHGGGGPGCGPVAVRDVLEPYLPKPVVARRPSGELYLDWNRPRSIGKLKGFWGHFGMMVRALTYISLQGGSGLREISEAAVLNANYLRARLSGVYDVPYDRICMHEFVASGRSQRQYGVRTLDIAKRLIDFEIHPPTVYFPLIVEEAIMVEPTEAENKDTLDRFADVMLQIAREAEENPEIIHQAPHNRVVGRLDETTAARRPVLRWARVPAQAASAPAY
ncbi:MAG TPA: aminomethyl-transferring glycine dehydrogenase subunit GcvPB [Chloroflexota bacterium]|nr:aminomethyl-transferring glycine dehydrogenase subunit GcvPB [Chloroflexota bacterium]